MNEDKSRSEFDEKKDKRNPINQDTIQLDFQVIWTKYPKKIANQMVIR